MTNSDSTCLHNPHINRSNVLRISITEYVDKMYDLQAFEVTPVI